MRILIAPFIQCPRADAAYYITQNLAVTFSQENHAVAISGDTANHFHHASVYTCPKIKKPLVNMKDQRSYEAWLYSHGGSTRDYLLNDLKCMDEAISHFHPDLIIVMDRPAAVMAARAKHIPCWVIVNSDMYKKTWFSSKAMDAVNEVLDNLHMEQVFTLKDLYAKCERRIGFGPIEAQPFSESQHTDRIDIASVYPIHVKQTNRVCIFLPDVHKRSLPKILTDGFKGAPYSVYAWYRECRASRSENMHFMAAPKPDLLPGSIACVHDGNAYLMNQCLARGIPQVIITDHNYIRNYNAMCVSRNLCGLSIYENELTMGKLYETYRAVLSDDTYYYHTQALKDITCKGTDISEILHLL